MPGFCLARLTPRNIPVADELDDAIRTSAEGPEEAMVDGVRMKQHPLPDQIAADRYLASKKAARSKGLGIRLTKVVPPGAA
jgi:hypothetical protein